MEKKKKKKKKTLVPLQKLNFEPLAQGVWTTLDEDHSSWPESIGWHSYAIVLW